MDPSSLILPFSVAPSFHGFVISEWTGPWSDGSICLLKNIPSLTSWLRVINVVGHVVSIQWLITWNEVFLCLPRRSFYINLKPEPCSWGWSLYKVFDFIKSEISHLGLYHPAMFALTIVVPKKYALPFLLSLRRSRRYHARWHNAWAYRSLPSKGSHLINPMACCMAFENTNEVSAIIWSLQERIAPLVAPPGYSWNPC